MPGHFFKTVFVNALPKDPVLPVIKIDLPSRFNAINYIIRNFLSEGLNNKHEFSFKVNDSINPG